MIKLYVDLPKYTGDTVMIRAVDSETKRVQLGWQTATDKDGITITGYFDPATGNMLLSWNKIDGNWYYFSYIKPYIWSGPITIYGNECIINEKGMLEGYNDDRVPNTVPIFEHSL